MTWQKLAVDAMYVIMALCAVGIFVEGRKFLYHRKQMKGDRK